MPLPRALRNTGGHHDLLTASLQRISENAMIFPLLLLALGLGTVAAYELSSKTHAWVDEHVDAIKGAIAAHQVAEDHLDAAQAALPPEAPAAQQQLAQDHAVAALGANAAGAHKTAQGAATAQTPSQRAVAMWMAALTLAMQEQIKMFAAIQIAQNQVERTLAQKQYDYAVGKIRSAKGELSKLGVHV
jgi:hypothetical protein